MSLLLLFNGGGGPFPEPEPPPGDAYGGGVAGIVAVQQARAGIDDGEGASIGQVTGGKMGMD